jgi:hypothetical protein
MLVATAAVSFSQIFAGLDAAILEALHLASE